MIVPTPSYTDTVDLLHWAPLLTAFICKPLSKHVFSLRCKKIIFLQWYLASARHIQSFEVGAVLRLVCRFGHVARLVCVCFAFLNTAAFVMRCVKSYHRVWWISIKAIVFQVCCDASDWFESLESDGFHLSKNQTLKKGSWSPWSTQMNSKQDPAYSSMFMSRKVETRIMKWNLMIIWNKRLHSLVTKSWKSWNSDSLELLLRQVIGSKKNCGSDSKIRRFGGFSAFRASSRIDLSSGTPPAELWLGPWAKRQLSLIWSLIWWSFDLVAK